MESKVRINLIPFNKFQINIMKDVESSSEPILNKEDETTNIHLEEDIKFIQTENLYNPSFD